MIIGTIALFGMLNIITVWFFSKSMLKGLLGRVNQLDSTIAEAIQAVLSGGIQPTEQVNPLQLMLFDIIKENFSKKNPDLNLLRDNEGKFT